MSYFQEAAKWFSEAEHLFFKDEIQAKQVFCTGMKNLALALDEIRSVLDKDQKKEG